MQKFKGTVSTFRSINRFRVQIELDEQPGIFVLDIDQDWVINKGDKLSLAGFYDTTGKIHIIAYENLTKAVRGWKYKKSLKFNIFGVSFASFIFLLVLFITSFMPDGEPLVLIVKYFFLMLSLFFIFQGLVGLKKQVRFNRMCKKANRLLS